MILMSRTQSTRSFVSGPFLVQLVYVRALTMGSRVEPLSYRLYDDSNV
jgi:hypothetical protein